MKIKNYFISIIIFFFTASISSQTNYLNLGCESPTLQSMQTFSHNNCVSINGCNSSDDDVSNYIPNQNNSNK